MRRFPASFFACLIVSIGTLVTGVAQSADLEGGMLEWPRADMAQALSIYVSRRIVEEEVPGLAIAVVSEGEIVFEQGYGSADLWGDEPVTPNTLFEAASLGKPVMAIGALGLVRERKLFLDVPLGQSLNEPWVGDDEDHALITLRQVLTHTSGLSNIVWCCSNETWTPPGEEFSYSGVGYMYLGAVMAEISEMPFDKFMRLNVLRPLNMASSGYSLADPLVETVARGFVPLFFPLMVFFIPLIVIFVVLAITSVLIVRLWIHRLKLEATDFYAAAGASLFVTLFLIALMLGFWGFLFIVAYVVAFSVFLFLGTLVLLLVFAFLGLLGPGDGTLAQGQRNTGSVMSLVAFALVVASSLFVVGINVPVPAMNGDVVNPAFSLRSSAHDLGLFVEGVIAGDVSSPQLRDRAFSDAVDIGNGIGWGLGFGVRDGATGRTGWQWGSNPGFESIMVIDPKRRAGVIVLTNSAKGGPLVQEIAGHIMGEAPGWSVP